MGGPAEGWRPPLLLCGSGFSLSRPWVSHTPLSTGRVAGSAASAPRFWGEKCGPLTPRRVGQTPAQTPGTCHQRWPRSHLAPRTRGIPVPRTPASVQGCWHGMNRSSLKGLTLLCVPVPFSPTGCRCQGLRRDFCWFHSLQEFLWVHVFT